MSIYHGWTPTVPLEIRIENLLEQIPPEHQVRAIAVCVCENPEDLERNLTSYVLGKKWLPEGVEQPHPAVRAYELEKLMDEDDWNYDNGLFDTSPYHHATPVTEADEFPF